MSARDILKYKKLLFDGGFGTYFASLTHRPGRECETACLHESGLVKKIHREYIEAGAGAIKTNTFSVNRERFAEEDAALLLKEGYRLAMEAASEAQALSASKAQEVSAAKAQALSAGKTPEASSDEAASQGIPYVFADIGPVHVSSEKVHPAEEYIWTAQQFLALGADNFLIETLPGPDGVREVCEHIRTQRPDACIIVSFAMHTDGYTSDGLSASELAREIWNTGLVDAVGFNCVLSAREMLEKVAGMELEGIPLSLMPNAGYPIVVENRTIYEGNPLYYASMVAAMIRDLPDLTVIGGCCGTTPTFIRLAAQAMSGSIQAPATRFGKHNFKTVYAKEWQECEFWNRIHNKQKVRVVELDPPAHAELGRFMQGAWQLKEAGIDLLTLADNPGAGVRMDASMLACRVKREVGLDPLVHMTCRDRNRLATKSLLLGLYAEGIRNVLLVTGDPIPNAQRDEDKSVYQFNSRKLASFVSSFSREELPSPLHVFGALNINAYNFEIELRLAKEKLEKGMCGFLTQPVLSERGFQNLKRARKELDAIILGGILPITSEKNARFLDNEINGISVDPQITEMYIGKNRQEAEELAVSLSTQTARRIEPFVDGFYLITPFGRTALISRILQEIRDL